MKKMGKDITIIYSTSFLSFSTNFSIAEKLKYRRIILPKEKKEKIKVDESSTEDKSSHKKDHTIKKSNEQINKLIANKIKVKLPTIKIKEQNLKFVEPKKSNKVIQKNQPLTKGFQQVNKGKSKSKKKDIPFIKVLDQNKNKNAIINEDLQPKNNEVQLILNPLKEGDKGKVMITNGFLNQISYYHDEDEVLFFPFSAFELVDVYEELSTTFIVLDYSSRFTRKVQNCYFSDTFI